MKTVEVFHTYESGRMVLRTYEVPANCNRILVNPTEVWADRCVWGFDDQGEQIELRLISEVDGVLYGSTTKQE